MSLDLDVHSTGTSEPVLGSLPLLAKMSLPWASPGPTCLISPGQAGSYKGSPGLHNQLCPVAGTGPGAAQGLCRQQRWWQGLQIHHVVHGHRTPAAKDLSSEPLRGPNLCPNKGSKPSTTQRSNQRSTDSSQNLMVHWEPWAHGVSSSQKPFHRESPTN